MLVCDFSEKNPALKKLKEKARLCVILRNGICLVIMVFGKD